MVAERGLTELQACMLTCLGVAATFFLLLLSNTASTYDIIVASSTTSTTTPQPSSLSSTYILPPPTNLNASSQISPTFQQSPSSSLHDQTAKEKADVLLNALLTRIGKDGQGPIIVGGIGDSGTRGAREALINLGAQMLGMEYVVPKSKDSKIYMASYPTINSNGESEQLGPIDFYFVAVQHAHSLNYNESSMSFDHYHMGRQYVAKMVSRSMSISQQMRGQGKPIDPWGFKHPRTCLLMQYWYGSLKDKFVYVHVLRDGKDIVEGDNQKLYDNICEAYYGRVCDKGLTSKLDFWADLNRDVFDYALNSGMGPHQYVAIRVEDLVLGNIKCYERLAAFIGVSPTDMAARVAKSIQANQGHVSSYLGNKWSDDVKVTVENRVQHDSRAKAQFDFWGYHGDSYSFTKECEDLEWMKLMRKKKGPVPGDADWGLVAH